MIRSKYYAGMIDADGSVSVNFRKFEDEYAVYPTVGIYQKTDKGSMLSDWAKEWDVNIHHAHHQSVLLQGQKAIRALERTKNHMVVKRNVAEFVIPLMGTRVDKEGCKQIRAAVAEARTRGTQKNYPSRQWMAGYVDGDGCLGSNYQKGKGTYFYIDVVSHKSQTEGLRLMYKAFGGNLYQQGNCYHWKISINKHRADTILVPMLKHLKIKRDQGEYIVAQLRRGKHTKTGGATPDEAKAIHQTLQAMKRTNND